MAGITREAVLDVLKSITTPDGAFSIVDQDLVHGLVVKDGHIGFTIEVDPNEGAAFAPIRDMAEEKLRALPGVLSVTAVLTAHETSASEQMPQQQRRPQVQAGTAALKSKQGVDGVTHIIAVASGKGGVGKSTVAANLALALAEAGKSVGLLDADIYGPSVPKMMGLSGKPTSADGKKLAPMPAHGLKCMSIGSMVDQDTPMVWRGPMVMSALTQLLTDVDWAPLDILVVDMPPGTGDAQLTLSQRVPLAGAVIVSTPQDIALIDARKGLAMFRKTEVPILGIIENMSHYVCPNCGDEAHIFGHGGAKDTAEELGAPYLGGIPLHLDVRTAGDSGTPIFAASPEGEHAKAFRNIAAQVIENIEAAGSDGPTIEMV